MIGLDSAEIIVALLAVLISLVSLVKANRAEVLADLLNAPHLDLRVDCSNCDESVTAKKVVATLFNKGGYPAKITAGEIRRELVQLPEKPDRRKVKGVQLTPEIPHI